jgi:serine phosphatase RsbU (regulator of sigma subunit)
MPTGSFGYYVAYPAFILLAGVAATLVSIELRKHLMGSLREADARNSLELVKKELDIARSVQQALMPKTPPNLPGFDIAGWNRPASETGGDYYDWQVMPDGRLAVAIADVTGHGLGPAMLMAVCRAYARACFPVGPELRDAMARVNEHLHGDVSAGRFVTFAVALVDPKSGGVEVLSAGHGPMLHLESATGNITQLDGDGVPLGIMENEDYGMPRRMQLAPGDVLLLVTDGFIEWPRAGDGQQYGVDRLSDLLRKNAALPAQTLIERMDADICAFSGGSPQLDDMTAVVIKRTNGAVHHGG